MKEFTTAVAEVEREDADEAVYKFKVNGRECAAYHPGDGQFAVLMADLGKRSSIADKVAGIINFFSEVLDDSSQTYITNRLLDRKDPFGLEEVQDIMEWMVEEWSGRPTVPPSVSV